MIYRQTQHWHGASPGHFSQRHCLQELTQREDVMFDRLNASEHSRRDVGAADLAPRLQLRCSSPHASEVGATSVILLWKPLELDSRIVTYAVEFQPLVRLQACMHCRRHPGCLAATRIQSAIRTPALHDALHLCLQALPCSRADAT